MLLKKQYNTFFPPIVCIGTCSNFIKISKIEIRFGRYVGRRELIQLGILLSIPTLTGCGKLSIQPILRSSEETLPNSFARLLPEPWLIKPLKVKSNFAKDQLTIPPNSDLIAIGDGWISELEKESLQPISEERISTRFDYQTKEFLKGFGPELALRLFPIGVSPWVMLFRNGEPWASSAKEGWNVLLDPDLRGRVVLPSSPRFVMSIANKIDEPDALRKLRIQALTFDDRNSLNWILSGKARVVILPLIRCFSSLIRDPRIIILEKIVNDYKL